MMSNRDWDDDDRPSWREIDKSRDRSSHRKTERSSYSSSSRSNISQRLKKQLLREADKAFKGKKATADYKKKLQAIHDAFGTDKFEESIKAFTDKFGVPDDDWSTLVLLLDSSDQSVVLNALQAMDQGIDQRSLPEQNASKSKLRILSLTARDPEVMDLVQQLMEKL